MQAPWWRSKTETCRSDIYIYFNVNFNVFFKIKKCICWWVNCTYVKLHGAKFKKKKKTFGYFRGRKRKRCWMSLLCCATACLVRNRFILMEIQTEFVLNFCRFKKIGVFLWCDFSMSFSAVALHMIQITQIICNYFV